MKDKVTSSGRGSRQQKAVETAEIKINGTYQLWGSLHCWKHMLCSQVKQLTITTTHLILVYCRVLFCESRTYCYFTLVHPVHLIHLNISNGLLRSDVVSTKLHDITPQKAINLTLRTSTLNYHLSSSYKTFPRNKSHVLFCSV